MTTSKITPDHDTSAHPRETADNAHPEPMPTPANGGEHSRGEHTEVATPRGPRSGGILVATVSTAAGMTTSWWIYTRTEVPIGGWAAVLIVVLAIWALGVLAGRRKSRRAARTEPRS